MLYMSVNSYQLLKMGILGRGDIISEDNNGKVLKIIKKAVSIGEAIPFIGRLCRILSKVIGFYVGLK